MNIFITEKEKEKKPSMSTRKQTTVKSRSIQDIAMIKVTVSVYHFSSLTRGTNALQTRGGSWLASETVQFWCAPHPTPGDPSQIRGSSHPSISRSSHTTPRVVTIDRSLEHSNLDPTLWSALRAPRTHKVKVRSNLLPQATRGVFSFLW